MKLKRGWYVVTFPDGTREPHYFEAPTSLCGRAGVAEDAAEPFELPKHLGALWQCRRCQAALSPTKFLFLENGEVVELREP